MAGRRLWYCEQLVDTCELDELLFGARAAVEEACQRVTACATLVYAGRLGGVELAVLCRLLIGSGEVFVVVDQEVGRGGGGRRRGVSVGAAHAEKRAETRRADVDHLVRGADLLEVLFEQVAALLDGRGARVLFAEDRMLSDRECVGLEFSLFFFIS